MILTPDVIQGFSQSMLQKSFDVACSSPDAHYLRLLAVYAAKEL